MKTYTCNICGVKTHDIYWDLHGNGNCKDCNLLGLVVDPRVEIRDRKIREVLGED